MPKITTDVKKDRDGFFTGQVVVWDAGTRLYARKAGITRLTYADALEDAGARLRGEEKLDNSPLTKLLPLIERAAGGEVVSVSQLPLPDEVVPSAATPLM